MYYLTLVRFQFFQCFLIYTFVQYIIHLHIKLNSYNNSNNINTYVSRESLLLKVNFHYSYIKYISQ